MPTVDRLNRRTLIVIALLVAIILASTAVTPVVGTGDSMQPRYQPCDLLLVDTLRDSAEAVHVGDTIAYRSGSGLLVHEVVGVAFDKDYVLAKGLNRDARERVTSDMLVGVVLTDVETSAICSAIS